MQVSNWIWVLFGVVVLAALAIDLGMLGLRALYFLLAGVVERFRYLRVGLAAILIFFGARLLLSEIVEFPAFRRTPGTSANGPSASRF